MGEADGTPRYDKRIHALVSGRQHEEWKSLTQGDDAPYESMSQLVRLSVQREVADENPSARVEGGFSQELENTIHTMADNIESLDSRLSSIEERLSKVESESDTDGYELQGEILNALPKNEGNDIDNVEEWAVTPVEIAAKINAEVDAVFTQLEELWVDTSIVKREFPADQETDYGSYFYRRI